MKKQNPPHCWNGSKIQQNNRRKRQNRGPYNYSVIHVHLIGFLFVTTSRFFPHSGLVTGFNRTDATSGAGTAYPSGAREFTPGFQWGSCYSIFSFICMFCRSLFVLLYFFFWPLYCLYFFDMRILITNLVSSNSSYNINHNVWVFSKLLKRYQDCNCKYKYQKSKKESRDTGKQTNKQKTKHTTHNTINSKDVQHGPH